MKFSEDFLRNKMFTNHALSFEKPDRETVNGECVDTGAMLQENGDYIFRIYAPKAEDVRILLNWNQEPLILKKPWPSFFRISGS